MFPHPTSRENAPDAPTLRRLLLCVLNGADDALSLVCDVQGVEDLYTDPQTHTRPDKMHMLRKTIEVMDIAFLTQLPPLFQPKINRK